jgi:4-hydroxy 2-oxovalerate aldolase
MILDCTLRDGGYYTAWDFSEELARDLLFALDRSGVDIIELGYRSRARTGFFGLFKYCDEELVSRLLPADRSAALAFMLDCKEFLTDGAVDVEALRAVIRPAADSIFAWCRVATHPNTVEAAAEMATLLDSWGYAVALNIMGISTLDGDRLHATIAATKAAPIRVLYLADSYGSLTPAATLEKIAAMREAWGGPVGVHMHENQGLALANTMAAIEEGVEFADATVSGMGRGSGNLRLEQLLLWLDQTGRRDDLSPGHLLPVLQKHLMPMRAAYGWGWDFSYMLSGLVEIHPTYCQKLKAGDRYDLVDVAAILDLIPEASRAKYSAEVLLAAETAYGERTQAGDEIAVTETFAGLDGDDVLIVANGPNLRRHATAVRAFVERHQPTVIECNHTGQLDGIPRTTLVMNSVRIDELAAACPHDEARTLGVGANVVPDTLAGERLARVPFELRVGRFEVTPDLVLPAHVVGMLAVGIGLRAKPRRIFLVGFDGYADADRRAEHTEMETFWSKARELAADVELVSLTPTAYSLTSSSLYGWLG